MTAELIVTNARVLTMDDAHPRAEAVALAGDRILAVGTRAEVEALAGPQTQVIDGRGRTLLPGFFESHLHLVLGGAELAHLQLSGVYGPEALARAFRAFAAAHPDRPLLMAQGADYGMLDHPLSRHDLDAVIADRPIAMTAYDHHTVWANTAALRAAGLLQGAATAAGARGGDGGGRHRHRRAARVRGLRPGDRAGRRGAALPRHRHGGRARAGALGRRARGGPRQDRRRAGALRGPRHHLDGEHGRQPLHAGPAARDAAGGGADRARQGAVPLQAADGPARTGTRRGDDAGFR